MSEDRVDHLELTSVRIHELALQRWLHKAFIFKEGFPLPVVFSTPRDAHAEFSRLWNNDRGPYAYLRELKDANGDNVYPYPSNIIYPLISVKKLNWRLRPQQSYGIHRNRHLYWPTVMGTKPVDATVIGNGTITRDDLAWSAKSTMPVGWDFRYQIDHYCQEPQTQAVFVNQLMRRLRYTGGSAQTFIVVRYPFPQKKQYARMYLESDIDNVNNEPVNDEAQEIRTSFTLVIEGYWYDYLTEFNPAMWYFGLGAEGSVLPPDELARWFDFHDTYPGMEDVRVGANNPTIESRDSLPPPAE